jgi:hypothetical protein
MSAAAVRFIRAALAQGAVNERVAEQRRRDIVSSRNWEAIAAFASLHMLAPALHPALSERRLAAELPADFADFLEAIYELNAHRNRELLLETARIAGLLRDGGIEPPVVLKGTAYLITGVIKHTGGRVILDLDLLLGAKDAEEAVRILLRSGMTCMVPDRVPTDGSRHHYPRLCRPDCRFGVEVHSRLPDAYSIVRGEDILRESTVTSVEGAPVRVPSPEHLALHHILHTQAEVPPDNRILPPLRNVYDMAQIAARFHEQLDWDRITGLFRGAGQGHILGMYLAFGSYFFGMPLDPAVRPAIADQLRARHAAALYGLGRWRIADPWYLMEFFGRWMGSAAALTASPAGLRKLRRNICNRQFYASILKGL